MVEQALNDRRLAKSTVAVYEGGVDGAIAHYAEHQTPNLILVEALEPHEELSAKLESLAEVCDSGTQVIVLGKENDVQIYRAMLQQGISDYLVPPFNPMQILDAVASVTQDPDEQPAGRIITFMGTKGGVGSSTICHNTAWCLAKLFDDDVGILDLDFAFGTVGLAFNLEAAQGIQDALAHPERLDEVLLERFMAKHDEHIFLLTSTGTLDQDADIDPEAFDVLLGLVRTTVPFVVIDCPHRWSDWTRRVMSSSDEIILTATPDLACLRDTKNLYDVLNEKRTNDSPLRVVINKFGAAPKTQLTVKDFEATLEADPDLTIPYDPNLFGTAANNGQMIAEGKRHKIVDGFEKLAQDISGREPPKNKSTKTKKSGGFSLFKGKGGDSGSKKKGKGD